MFKQAYFYIYKLLEKTLQAIKLNFIDELSQIRLAHKVGTKIIKQPDHYLIQKQDLNRTIKLRKGSSDPLLFRRIFLDEDYGTLVNLICDFINAKNINLIIDLGANIGLTAIYFQNKFVEAKIICLEPDSNNFSTLEFNCIGLKNVTAINKAIWSRNEKLVFDDSFRDKLEWSRRVINTKSNKLLEETLDSIEGITLSNIINNYEIEYIDILKIDIEGSEKELFDNPSIKEVLKITKFISIEIHDEFNCRQNIYSVLTECSFILIEKGELTIGYNTLFNKK